MNRRLTVRACRIVFPAVLVLTSPAALPLSSVSAPTSRAAIAPAAVAAPREAVSAPANAARPAPLKPSKPAARAGHVVYPFHTLDPAALAVAKQKAGHAVQGRAPLVPTPATTTGLFNNTNQAGIAAGDEGACCTPPDTTGSIGPANYLEIVNNLVRVYDRNLNRISDMDLGSFAGTPSGLSTSDPQMQWDPQGNRWLYAAVAFATGNNYLLLGWSKTANPADLANGWCHFGLYTANFLQDYPKLGHDNNYIVVGTNQYDDSKTGFPFVTATIWALPKPVSGDGSCAVGTSSHFGDATHVLNNADGSPAFTPVPANTSDSSSTGYIVAAHSPLNTPPGPQTKVMVWHMAKGGSGPQLVQDGDLTVSHFDIPPAIPQPGPSLDSLDARITQAVSHRDPDAGNAEAVWTQHTVLSSGSQSVVRWYEFIPGQLKVRQQGEISSSTDYIFNGAISPSILGNDAALFYNRANSSLTPVIGAVSRTHGDPLSTMESELLIGSSAAADQDLSCRSPYGPPCRWGDYSGASPDPSAAGVIWGSNQVNGPVFFGFPQWATRNFAVQATVAPDFGLSISPTGRAVTPSGSTTYTVNIAAQGGFSGAVTLSVSGLPAGATSAFSPNPATSTSTLTISTSSSAPASTSLFTVTGVNGSLSHAAQSTLVVTASTAYASTVMADGPNAYWRLGETSGSTMVDSTSSANDGAYTGGVTLNAPAAIVGDPDGGILLDGATGYGRAPNSSSLSLTGDVSVEAWVKWTAIATNTQDVVSKADGATLPGSSYLLGFVSGCSGCGMGFYTFSGSNFVCACQSNALPSGRWFHLVGTRSSASGQVAFYVNGSLVATASSGTGALNNVSSGVGVGASGSGAGSSLYPTNATMDDVAIYPTALSAARVSAHYQASGNANPPGAPTSVAATAGVNQASVTWQPPAGSSGITGFIAAAYAGTSQKNAVAVSGTASSATLYGLQGGTAYTIQVQAVNGNGAGPGASSNAVTPTGSATTYASTVLADGPSLYYRLSDPSGVTAPDSSAHGNVGSYSGGYTQNQPGALPTDPDGATLFDGVSGNVHASSTSSISLTGDVSVEAWVKWTATATGTQDVVSKGDGATLTGSSYVLGYVSGCQSGCGMGFYVFIGNSFVCACQSSALPAGQWFHLVGTRSGANGQVAFYVNGSLVATAISGAGALNNVPAGLGIGASGSGTGSSLYPTNATIDDAAVYPTVLSAAAVSNHYQASGNASPPGTPTNVSATAGVNQATVTWQAPAGAIPVTGYIATAFIGSAAQNAVAVSGSSRSATLFGLQGSSAYTIQVQARNSNGNGPPATSNVVTPTGATSTYASTVIADGPVLYDRLGDPSGTVAPDSSAQGNTGTYAGGYMLNQSGALPNDPDGATLFDGVSGNVRAPTSNSLDITGAISLETWVKWTATPTTTQDLISKGDGATLTGSAYALAYVSGCSGCGLGLYTFVGNTYVCACQSSAPAAGQWLFLVGTRTATGQLAFYVNGNLVATASDGGGPLNHVPSGVGIGASGGGTGSSLYPTNGTLDEAAIYPAALSSARVNAHFQASGQGTLPGAPNSVSATAGANQASVTWQPPGGSAPVTGYVATAYAGSTAKNAVAVGSTATSATVFGLQGGTTYTIQVRAVNSQGSGPAVNSNAITPTGAATTYASTVLGDGPVLYQRLGDPSGAIAPDSSGNGNTGTYVGGVTLNQPGALVNDPDGATLFDGSTGNVRAPNSSSLNLTGAVTVEAWVKWTATATTTQDLINKADGATLAGSAFSLAFVQGCSGCGLGFYSFVGNSYTCACQSSALPAGQWFHLVGTRTAGGQLAFYINGALVATANDGGGALNTVPSGVGVGAAGGGSGSSLYPTNATIDEAAVYPSALSATQVSNHYHAAGY